MRMRRVGGHSDERECCGIRTTPLSRLPEKAPSHRKAPELRAFRARTVPWWVPVAKLLFAKARSNRKEASRFRHHPRCQNFSNEPAHHIQTSTSSHPVTRRQAELIGTSPGRTKRQESNHVPAAFATKEPSGNQQTVELIQRADAAHSGRKTAEARCSQEGSSQPSPAEECQP